jgi:hypothetical protein
MLEFYVYSITLDGLIVGRCGNKNIPLGTKFTSLRLIRSHKTNSVYESEELGETASVSLTLLEVHWYRNSIDCVPGGHAAALRVVGEGLDELAEQLRSQQKNDHLLLTGHLYYNAEIT